MTTGTFEAGSRIDGYNDRLMKKRAAKICTVEVRLRRFAATRFAPAANFAQESFAPVRFAS